MLLCFRTSLLLIFIMFSQTAFSGNSTVTYDSTDAIFINPERGFSAYWSSSVTPSLITNLRNQNVSVIQRIYTIPAFNDERLSDTFLELVEEDLNTARDGGVKLVMRFSYTNNQNGDDAPLDTILLHIDQLKPVFQRNYDVIAYIEAGFIGAWGEWYYSSNNLNNTVSRRAVLYALLDALPGKRCVVVRTPDYKRKIFADNEPLTLEEAYSGTKKSRTGAHNDCFLASETDYGTYVGNDIEGDKDYLNQDNRFVPQGGETCKPSEYSGCENAKIDLERMHWSVLNKDYNRTVLNDWIDNGCMDEIKRRLGYRFRLLDASLPDSIKPGNELFATLKIENKGYASPYNPRNLEILLRHQETAQKYYLITGEDPRLWMSGDTSAIEINAGIPDDIPEGPYSILLHLADPEPELHNRPEYSIRLANESVWEDSTGYNSLLHSVTISTEAGGTVYSGDHYFEPYSGHPSDLRTGEILMPENHKLTGNYPNPFNAGTVIKYELSRSAHVRLDILNSRGQRVETILNGTQSAGAHRIRWEPQDFSSGTYFYRLYVNGITEMGKAIYLK